MNVAPPSFTSPISPNFCCLAFLHGPGLCSLSGGKPEAPGCFFSRPYSTPSLSEQNLLGPGSGRGCGSDLGHSKRTARRAPVLLQLQVHWGDQNTLRNPARPACSLDKHHMCTESAGPGPGWALLGGLGSGRDPYKKMERGFFREHGKTTSSATHQLCDFGQVT